MPHSEPPPDETAVAPTETKQIAEEEDEYSDEDTLPAKALTRMNDTTKPVEEMKSADE